mgnify:FL=1
MKIGYARVSTIHQDPQLQLNALEGYGCERIYQEQSSGANRARPELAQLMKALRAGDELVVWKLDRLCRSVSHLINICEQLDEVGATLVSITDNIDQSTPAGKALLVIMGTIAEMERELIRERIMAGVEARKQKGLPTGRPTIDDTKIRTARALINDGETYAEVARMIGISRSTLYKYCPVED